MSKSKSFFNKPYSRHIGATTLLLACVLSLIFVVIGTPLGVLKMKDPPYSCYTLWGTRPCNSPNYDDRVEWDPCTARRHRFEFGEACSILSMAFFVANFIACWYCIGGADIKWWIVGISVFSIASCTVPWAVVASIYHVEFCGSGKYTHMNTKYDAGFALLVTGFVVQCVGVIAFVVLEKRPESWESGGGRKNGRREDDEENNTPTAY
ncbi:amastin [Trypanosoma grayi]|uniref:amastin n=1 Tax=Trypanosoma grayi TaxID=71804 RepID=UPI0004F4A0E2|nr:amastin [Trypanosoma grayi]KEG09349.1 amastin [Trypanosoma grayi]